MRVLAWLLATACAAHAGEATEAASGTTDQFKLLIGSVLMSDYIFRGISYSAHQPAVGAYVDAQQGWLYVYTNFNSVRFSTNPAGELTMAAGARPTSGRPGRGEPTQAARSRSICRANSFPPR